MKVPLGGAVAARAAAVAAGEEPAVPLEPAATVVLVRPTADGGVEAYVQRRHRGLAFAGGVYAFPGGRVDPADADLPDGLWGGPSPAEWARRFAEADESQARAHVAGLVRELYEETGVLLAQGSPRLPAESDRVAVAEGRRHLREVLQAHGLRVDTDVLTPWARWVTPRFERRRFDAWFFLAALPRGQQPRVATAESHDGRWVRPAEAVAAAEAGEMPMLPPTWWTLRQVAEAATVEQAAAHPPPMVRYTVGWTRRDGEVLLVLPDDPDYPGLDPREGT